MFYEFILVMLYCWPVFRGRNKRNVGKPGRNFESLQFFFLFNFDAIVLGMLTRTDHCETLWIAGPVFLLHADNVMENNIKTCNHINTLYRLVLIGNKKLLGPLKKVSLSYTPVFAIYRVYALDRY